MDAVEHDLTPEQWAELQAAWGGGCAYCGATGTPLQRDCGKDPVLPTLRTLRAGPWTGPGRKRLDERAFLARHVEIRAELAARFADA